MKELTGVRFTRNRLSGDSYVWTLFEFIQLTMRKGHYEIFPSTDNIALLVFILVNFRSTNLTLT